MTDPTPEVPPSVDRAVLQDRALRGASWTMIHTVVSLPVAFAANLVLARILGVEDYGRLAFLTVLLSIASAVVELGLTSALIQYGSRAHAAGRPDEVKRLLSASQGFRLLIAAPLMTLLVIAVADIDARLMVVVVVFGIWVPTALGGALICIVVENKSATSAKLAMISNLVLQVAVVAVAYFMRTADAVWGGRMVVGGLLIALYLVPISSAYRRAVLRPSLPKGFPPGFWRFALPTGLAGLIGTLALSRTEVFFLNWLSTPEAVGLFALAFGLASHIFAPAQALINPLIPAVSGLHAVDPQALAPAFERVLRASSTLIAMACAVGLPALALLVTPLYGTEFAPAAPLLLALGVAGALLAAGEPVSAFTLGRLSARALLTASSIALVINVSLAVALIPVLGVWGAVVANVVGAASRLLLLVNGEVNALGISWARIGNQVMPALVAMPVAVTVWLTGGLVPGPRWVAAVAMACVGFAMLVAGMRLTRSGMTAEDKAILSRMLPRPLRRGVSPLLGLIARG